MIEVNYQCNPCRPFTKERVCAMCLKSQLEVLKYKRDLKQLLGSDAKDKRDDVFSVFSESELPEADVEGEQANVVSVFSEYELVVTDVDEPFNLEGEANEL